MVILFQAVVLGILQGLGELLPISSSGHLVLLPWLFGWDYQGVAFDVMLHAGTLIAVLVYFRRDVGHLVRALLFQLAGQRGESVMYRQLLLYLVVGTLPAVFFGYVLRDLFSGVARHPVVIAIALIFMGVVLWVADRSVTKRKDPRPIGTMTWGHALFIGFFQALALIPGVSRSGSTISGTLLLGYGRRDSARFSFLLSIPVLIAALALSVIDFVREGGFQIEMIVGMIVAGLAGYGAIHFLMKYVERRSYTLFVVYRIVLGVVVLAFWYLR